MTGLCIHPERTGTGVHLLPPSPSGDLGRETGMSFPQKGPWSRDLGNPSLPMKGPGTKNQGTPSPSHEQTHTCENITARRTLYMAVILLLPATIVFYIDRNYILGVFIGWFKIDTTIQVSILDHNNDEISSENFFHAP